MMPEAKPNILFITTDEQRWDQIGITGLTGIETPNMDRLAREGVCLTRAYSASPTCTPCRVTMLTGQYPSIHGAYTIGVTPDPFPRPLLTETLQDSGYYTALVGKHHFVQRCKEEEHLGAPENDADKMDYYRRWHGPWLGFDEVYASSGHTKSGNPKQHYRVWLEERHNDYEKYFPELGGTAPAYGAWHLPAELSDSAFVSERISKIIEEQKDQNWFCWASFQDPHGPFVCPKEWFERVDTEAMPEPMEGYRKGEFDDRPKFYAKIHAANEQWGEKSYRVDGLELGGVYGHAEDVENERTIMQVEAGLVGMLDHYIGEMLKTLERTGQLDNTIIILTSDHGTMLGHHGLWGKGMAAYEDCQRVPFIAWGKPIERRGVKDDLANVADIPRTILSLCGCEIPQGMQGTDLGNYLRGETDQTVEATLIEYRASQ
ncbi:MAG: sulfatase, partial [Candidatus Sumerlaeota bacterium]